MNEEILIRFRLVGQEAHALRQWSAKEMRHPRDQVRHILTQELCRHGWLPMPEPRSAEVQPAGQGHTDER